jgi:hypothetical protein
VSTARTVFEMGLREYARTPVLLALLVFLPAYFVLVFAQVMPEEPFPIEVPVQGTMHIAMTSVIPVVMGPMATALVGGAAGLFLMQSARTVDGRLSIVGASAPEILLARGGVLTVAAVVASVVSVGVVTATYVPQNPGWVLIATLLVGLMYGGVGALVGLVLNRLAGVYVLMFGPLFDLFLAQSPLSEETPAVAPYLPGHYPMKLAFDATFTTAVEPGNLWWAVAYLLGIAVVVGLALDRTLRLR